MSVKVNIIAGRELAAKDKSGKSDPFVVVEIMGTKRGHKKKKTKTIKQNLNPVWDQEFTLPVKDVRKQALQFTCYDYDRFAKNDFMGSCVIQMKEIMEAGNKLDDWFTWISNPKGDKVSGDVHLRIELSPPKGQETVFKPKPKPEPTVSAAPTKEASGSDGKKAAVTIAPPKEEEDSEPSEEEDVSGKSFADVYTIGAELGKGAFAVVRQCTHKKTGKEYAVKVIEKHVLAEDASKSLEREVSIMKKMHHRNIIKLKSIFEDSKVYLVMELVTGGELFDRIVDKGSYSERDAALLVAKIVDAIAYLHSQKIAHRDLKPENLLLKSKSSDTRVKIADFGLSRMIDEKAMMQTACGTPGYVAPEVLKATGYGPEVDLWSIGVITYILLCGFPPFYGETIPEIFEQIMAADFDYPDDYWKGISKAAKDFINKLLVIEPGKRMTAKQALEHPWLRGIDSLESVADLSKVKQRIKRTIVQRRTDSSPDMAED